VYHGGMADNLQNPVTALNTPLGRQAGEPNERRYTLTDGKVAPFQRPGALGGSNSGGEGDPGRDGIAKLLPDDISLPGYTGT
jgi:hypothetical protein